MSAEIRYNGSAIATVEPGTTKILECAGKKMKTNVAVEVSEDPQPILQEKTATENGEVAPDEGYDGLSKVTVNVESDDTYKTQLMGIIDKTIGKFTIPPELTIIGKYVFHTCPDLELDTIPASVTSVGAFAFYKCDKITSLTFKGTPKTINPLAFNTCNNLVTINVPWSEGEVADAPWGATNATINYNYVEE